MTTNEENPTVAIGPHTAHILRELQPAISDLEIMFNWPDGMLEQGLDLDSQDFAKRLAGLMVKHADKGPTERASIFAGELGLFIVLAMVLDLRNEVEALDQL